ncbi:TIGR01777 family protein [Ancylomarina euxinus]|uniref:TIGR01777 family protein n=1 Tax=Ancylomarina euxinus TaxID=2283627 RepID=A0A425Y884_9BACT|nr:TIGR01777 family oxidoreductase [Ancylomarina euxinus]MCZ4693399.1 TIGR01777 family oxidoreductase [Ancylomarina euxinus]MUP13626.1 TIGR01777 family protein [Ancylomarina euxinus]RRG24731.1 TIGR01777 family protein [Ancylomarina euxinus]
MAQVLISGGSGVVGKVLCEKLRMKGYHVAILSRSINKSKKLKTYLWDPTNNQIDPEAISSSDYIIHLAGANIAEKRWTVSRKKLILDSRVQSANLIFNEVKKQKKELKAFISASAIGYYGSITSDTIFTEDNHAANDFLGQTCLVWEQAARQFETLGIRTSILRTGLVLNKEKGGALSKMLIPVKMGFASSMGNGKQYLPWIHIDDLCELYIRAIENISIEGAFNAVAPDFQTNKSFTQTLAKTLNKPFFFPNIPAFLLKLVLGEMSVILIKGSRVSANKLIKNGFIFKFSKLNSALRNLLN